MVIYTYAVDFYGFMMECWF